MPYTFSSRTKPGSAGAESPYILVKGTVKDTRKRVMEGHAGRGKHKHYRIKVDAGGKVYGVAINVYSYEAPHALRYWCFDNYRAGLVERVAVLADGVYHELGRGHDSLAVDYIRGGLFDMSCKNVLPAPGPDDDNSTVLEGILDAWCRQAVCDDAIKACVWGIGYGNREIVGVHDVHMNQGNNARFAKENGVWHDGAIMFVREGASCALGALFLSFQSQCLKTDSNGDCV